MIVSKFSFLLLILIVYLISFLFFNSDLELDEFLVYLILIYFSYNISFQTLNLHNSHIDLIID